MNPYLYLSVVPEGLIASMLPPTEFGTYLATGTQKRPHGQAVYFQVDPDRIPEGYFDLEDLEHRCVPHDDGRPKHSIYLAIYRVLEHVPLDALQDLYLVTAHGRVLQLGRGKPAIESKAPYHLYQELVPVHPLIASCLDPEEFCKLITDPARAIRVPALCFAELELGELAADPEHGSASEAPYRDIDLLRHCLLEVYNGEKKTKTVDRLGRSNFLYRCIKGGVYVGNREQVVFYPYPTREELNSKFYGWWRCANDAEVAANTGLL